MFLLVYFLIVFSSKTASILLEVNTTCGIVRGTRDDKSNVIKYLGIPYAEAPIGNLRFRPPVRKSRMKGIFDATSNDFLCPQIPTKIVEYHTVNGSMTEDCLRLDIYVPSSASKSRPLAVMVWIHGGGFLWGESKTYDSSHLAGQNDVIVVAINYRLGILGFLSTNDNNALGDFGLRDQCAAIEWTVDNIAEFGGNPKSVTIFGESAGSMSTLYLATSSLCEGKFQRLIAQSGGLFGITLANKYPLENAKNLARQINCPMEPETIVNCLRQKPWQELLSHQPDSFNEPVYWTPSFSKDIFPEHPLDLARNPSSKVLQRFRSLDLLIGLTQEEGEFVLLFKIAGGFTVFEKINEKHALFSEDAFNKEIELMTRSFITQNPEEINMLQPALRFQYTNWKNKTEPYGNTRMLIRTFGDIYFVESIVRTARLHAGIDKTAMSKKNTYFYQFKRKPSWRFSYPWTNGATHTEELDFTFGFVDFLNSTDQEKALSKSLMEYWTNFAKTGSPNSPAVMFSNVTWPSFDLDKEKYLGLDVNMSVDAVRNYPYDRRVAFFDELVTRQLEIFRKANLHKTTTKCDKYMGYSSEANFMYNDFFSLIFILFISVLL